MAALTKVSKLGVQLVLSSLIFFLNISQSHAQIYPLPPFVLEALERGEMQHLATSRLNVYYPQARLAEALQISETLQNCLEGLEARAATVRLHKDYQAQIILTEAVFNNAFVVPEALGSSFMYMLLPLNFSLEYLANLGLPLDPSFISCHEAVHYVQMAQTKGVMSFLNGIFGPLFTPQIGFDTWFTEGLATYYESQRVRGRGRLNSPLWRGVFASLMDEYQDIGALLNPAMRGIPFSNGAYLAGSHFIEFLQERYGEARFWELIDLQAYSSITFLAANYRFSQVYGKPLTDLIAEFNRSWFKSKTASRAAKKDFRLKPVLVKPAGVYALYAGAPTGISALIASGAEEPPKLTVFSPELKVLLERELTDILPGRQIRTDQIANFGSLTFSADGQSLFFTVFQEGSFKPLTYLFKLDIATNQLVTLYEGLPGSGGSVTPDGSGYLFVKHTQDRSVLSRLEFQSKQIETLYTPQDPGEYLANPQVVKAGEYLLIKRWLKVKDEQDQAPKLWFFSGKTYQPLSPLTSIEGEEYDPLWLDSEQQIFAKGIDEQIQIFLKQSKGDFLTPTNSLVPLTATPYVALHPVVHVTKNSAGEVVYSLRFLERDKRRFNLMELKFTPADLRAEEFISKPAPPLPLASAALPLKLLKTPEPYSGLTELAIPRLRLFWLRSLANGRQEYSLYLGGSDRLGFHRWQLTLAVPTDPWRLTGSFTYTNGIAAPYLVNTQFVSAERESSLKLWLERTYFGNYFLLGVDGYEVSVKAPSTSFTRKFLGPKWSFSYTGLQTTPYAGIRRLFSLGIVTKYLLRVDPTLLEKNFSLLDLALSSEVTSPLPLSKRHTLTLSGRFRSIWGPPAKLPLLTVGGVSALDGFNLTQSIVAASTTAPVYLPQLNFSERLRGYEDYSFATNQLVSSSLVYRYPLILDRHYPALFAYGPSLFFRQLDIEAFTTLAYSKPLVANTTLAAWSRHQALGLALPLKFRLWYLAMTLGPQVTKRVTDDHGVVAYLVWQVGI